jgi:mono/diheme cytochrome c family protein
MKRSAALLLFLFGVGVGSASAQNLTPQQAHGRMILTQNCNICHLPQNPGSATYGPALNKDAANGDDNLMKEVIQNGLVKMPGWKYTLKDSEINDVIAYVRTLPVQPAPAARPRGNGQPED